MATLEQPPVQERLPRSRSARLADQAATAALFVTHPERRLSVRESVTSDIDPAVLKETGSRPGFSHASATAALAHAKARQGEARKQQAATYYIQDYRGTSVAPSEDGYKAAVSALRDRRAVSSLPPVSPDLVSSSERSSEARRGISEREKAIRAASGALRMTRRRAGSVPSDALLRVAPEENLDELDSAMEASRIQHVANTNARLYTSTPPVAPEVEEQRKQSVMHAAAVSMAQKMYGAKDDETKGSGPVRGVMTLQEAAEKRAAEKLAAMEDETAVYREYYGIEPETRASMRGASMRGASTQGRRRRLSTDSDDTSTFDAERSKAIRNQMYSLRSKLNAVDEQRERDRALLLEAAKRNVDSAIQDMEKRVYAQTGRAPPSLQKEWEESAMNRARKDVADLEGQITPVDKVNLGYKKYMDLDDIEAIARARLQPTFNEITDLAEGQRAKELEEKLDREEQLRHDALEREREAELRAEERHQREALKRDSKTKDEKAWPWKRRSRQSREFEEAPPAAGGQETVPLQPPKGEQQEAFASGAAGVAAATAAETVTKPESKFKSWFRSRRGRRPSAQISEPLRQGEEEKQPSKAADKERHATGKEASKEETAPKEEAPKEETAPKEQASKKEAEAEATKEDATKEEAPKEEAPKEDTAREQKATIIPVASEEAAEHDESRAAALRSHPVTANDLNVMKRTRMSVDEGQPSGQLVPGQGESNEPNNKSQKEKEKAKSDKTGDRPSRLRSRLTRFVSRSSSGSRGAAAEEEEEAREKTGDEEGAASAEAGGVSTYAHATPTTEREALRESAHEQSLPVPPAVGKRTSDGRESRFSEDL